MFKASAQPFWVGLAKPVSEGDETLVELMLPREILLTAGWLRVELSRLLSLLRVRLFPRSSAALFAAPTFGDCGFPRRFLEVFESCIAH